MNSSTSAPAIGAQDFKLYTLLKNGSSSPTILQMQAIWITGSFLASGKPPYYAAHSISKDSILSGAILEKSPVEWLQYTSL